jgi:hypothetical protein
MSQPTTPANGSVPPMPHTGANTDSSSPDAAVPPMPSEVAGGRAPDAGGRFRHAMAPLRKMMRRAA